MSWDSRFNGERSERRVEVGHEHVVNTIRGIDGQADGSLSFFVIPLLLRGFAFAVIGVVGHEFGVRLVGQGVFVPVRLENEAAEVDEVLADGGTGVAVFCAVRCDGDFRIESRDEIGVG